MKIRSIRLKKKVKERLKLFLLCMALIISLSLWFIPLKKVEGLNLNQTKKYVVLKGDTLWEIAENIDFTNKDIREIVNDIEKINDLGGNKIINEGDVLMLPVY